MFPVGVLFWKPCVGVLLWRLWWTWPPLPCSDLTLESFSLQESECGLVTTLPSVHGFIPEVFFSPLSPSRAQWSQLFSLFLWFKVKTATCLRRLDGFRRSQSSPAWRPSSSPTASYSGWAARHVMGDNKLKEQQWAKSGVGGGANGAHFLKSRQGVDYIVDM